jgi:hypothetical protein
MACYLGETESTGDTIPAWHDLECPWDDQDGKAPLCQLCRAVNDRLVALKQSAHSFWRIGSTAADGALAALDYEGNPTWGPPTDFAVILQQCVAQVTAMLNVSGFGGMLSGSYRWRWANGSTVRSTLDSELSGLIYTLQEDWEPIIVALRNALDSLSGADIESEAWESVTIYVAGHDFGVSTPVVEVTNQVLVGPKLSGVSPTPGGTSTTWSVPLNATNTYGNRATVCGSGTYANEFNGDIGVDYQFGNSDTHPDTYSGAAAAFCDTILGDSGWWVYESCTKTWEIYIFADIGVDLRAMDGKTLNWSISAIAAEGGGSPVEAFSVVGGGTSGSFVWSQASPSVSSEHSLEIDVELDDPAIASGTLPNDAPRGVVLQLDFTADAFEFCVDSAGVYHDA